MMFRSIAPLVALLVALGPGCITATHQEQAASRAQLGQAYLREHNPSGAVKVLEEAVELDRYNYNAWQNLALAYMSQGVYEEAELAFNKAIRLAPEKGEIHNNYGLLLLNRDRRAEAITQFELALKDLSYRSPAMVMSNLGYALYLEGRHIEAQSHLTEALRRAPTLCQARLNRGLVYVATSDADLALGDFQDVIDSCGTDLPSAYLHASELMLSQGDVYGGCTYLSELSQADPHSPLGRKAREARARSCQR